MLNNYKNNSCIGNKYAGYKRICWEKAVKFTKSIPASFKGYVYDDKSRPLANVKVSIGRTASVSTTDANGLFQLDNIPPGRIDLFVDGRTVNSSNDVTKPQYPSLHFEAYAIKGRDNQIAHPIYLPPLSTSPESVKTVGGNEDVVLKIPGLAGFQMKVKANSVTFPDGSRVGTLVVSPVTADKLPMAPPAGGAQFGVPAWTVQPAGTRFDPPIEVTLPNASSQPAGDNLPIVQWDHDLGQYVAMGRATVSEDGSVLITDSGSGLTKAGWGGLCRYDPDKCGKTGPPKCKDCEKLDTSGDCPTCAPDAAKNETKCESDACKQCKDGSCHEKFSKAEPNSVSRFNFIGPKTIAENLCAGTGWGCFTGIEGQPGVAIEMEVAPYCTPEGNWKFKLSKADYTTAIYANLGGILPTITFGVVSALRACNDLRALIENATIAASTHYLSPQIKPGPAYYHTQAIHAHEVIHFKQFEAEFASAIGAFKRTVEAITLPIDSYPTEAAAKAAVKASSEFSTAMGKMKVDSSEALGITAAHPDPLRYVNASLTSSPILQMLDAARARLATTGACTP
jgi:hypothetical protein